LAEGLRRVGTPLRRVSKRVIPEVYDERRPPIGAIP